MKNLLKGLVVVALAMTMTACGGSDSADAPKENETVTLTIGTSPDYPPYESLNTNNEIEGFDVDMVKLFEGYLTESEGKTYKLEFKQMNFDNIIIHL